MVHKTRDLLGIFTHVAQDTAQAFTQFIGHCAMKMIYFSFSDNNLSTFPWVKTYWYFHRIATVVHFPIVWLYIQLIRSLLWWVLIGNDAAEWAADYIR